MSEKFNGAKVPVYMTDWCKQGSYCDKAQGNGWGMRKYPFLYNYDINPFS